MESEFAAAHFLLDFAEEADELLQTLGRHLLELSQPLPAPRRASLFQEMLRGLHTLKGLCGMVGLEQAARLSHVLETLLARVNRGQLELDPELLDRLLESTRTLAASVSRASAGQEELDTQALAKQLESLGEAAPVEVPLTPEDDLVLAQATQSGKAVGMAWFEPSPDIVAEGWNVTRVRAHLETFGEVVKAVPVVNGPSVRFAFVVLHTPGAVPDPCPGMTWSVTSTPPPAPAPAVEPEAPRASNSTVRVEVSRLDDIMRLVGDLIISRWVLQVALDGQGRPAPAVKEAGNRMERLLRDLRRAVMRARMVPLAETFQRMPLVVRELSRATGREVRLTTHGEETQIDKVLVERLMDPLLHLVRNALAHGLETPAERVAAGKPPVGSLTLTGRPEGDSIIITVADDGRGLDLEKIARQAGVDAPLTPREALDIITRPGFSTRTEASLDAGRGVGMDVVKRALAEIGATLSVETQKGQGCTFQLRVPLTLAIMEAFILRVGRERYAVARDAVKEVIELPPEHITRSPHGNLFAWRGTTLPVVSLAERLQVPAGSDAAATPLGLVYVGERRKVVYLVDRVLGLREVVVRSLADPLLARPWLGGATELGDGGVALILDLGQLR